MARDVRLRKRHGRLRNVMVDCRNAWKVTETSWKVTERKRIEQKRIKNGTGRTSPENAACVGFWAFGEVELLAFFAVERPLDRPDKHIRKGAAAKGERLCL